MAIIFRQLFDDATSTFTYLLGTPGGVAVLIDPVRERVERDLTLVKELDLTLAWVLETHVHADHVTGAGELRERTGCKTGAAAGGAPCIDHPLAHGQTLLIGELVVEVIATPGHTSESLSYRIGDRVFTGDALLVRTAGRTDFQNGDAGQLYDSITERLFTLPDDTIVCPGHDYAGHTTSTIREEKRFNRRVVGRTREQFIELMTSLRLPPPRLLDVAVPANLACGRNTEPHGA